MEKHSRTAIVTGGARGIGRAIVAELASKGFSVLFTYVKNDGAAADVESYHRQRQEEVRACKADQSDPGAIESLFAVARDWFASAGEPYLDALVCSAGVLEHASIDQTSLDLFERVMSVNTRGTFFTLQRAARSMKNDGRIVCISTVGTAWPSAGEAVYAASKAAVEQFVRVASRELGERGITVNAVSPGPTDTDLLRRDVDASQLEGLAHMTALRRVGRPVDVASVVGFLVSPESGWITGRNICADGGLV
jgi:3-oxoacyl-[acyl-carrier protein] reductase